MASPELTPIEQTEDKKAPKYLGDPNNTIRLLGLDGDTVVFRSDLTSAREYDPAVEALKRNFPPPNPEAFEK
jgi:hypothetical protein